MPIVDVTMVVAPAEAVPDGLAQAVADAIGSALGLPPGQAWVRLQLLPAQRYAENAAALAGDELPVFVMLLHARPPEGEERMAEIARITQAVASATGRDATRVHLEFAPAGAGRIAFGGRLVE